MSAPVDDHHALVCGLVFGALMRSLPFLHELRVLDDEDGLHQAECLLLIGEHRVAYRVVIEPWPEA